MLSQQLFRLLFGQFDEFSIRKFSYFKRDKTGLLGPQYLASAALF